MSNFKLTIFYIKIKLNFIKEYQKIKSKYFKFILNLFYNLLKIKIIYITYYYEFINK